MKTFATQGAPHLPARTSVRRVMRDVLLALLPGIGASVWVFGIGVLLQITLATGFAIVIEAALLRLRGQPLRLFLGDLSAVVSAVLFALCLPPLCPWWVSLSGMLAAIGLAKQAYGGLGYNVFNPAMVAVVVVLLVFPRELAQWPAPGTAMDLFSVLSAIGSGQLPAPLSWDTVASATPLELVRDLVRQQRLLGEIRLDPAFGYVAGRGREFIAAAFALGGIYLAWRRVAAWQVPAAVIVATTALSLPLWLLDADIHPSPLQHLLSGGLMLAAWFIATDPVTGCSTPRGRWIFGAGVAAITLAIRRWGSYPDGVAFAILLMNALAPLIDQYTRPRIVGQGRHD